MAPILIPTPGLGDWIFNLCRLLKPKNAFAGTDSRKQPENKIYRIIVD